MHSTELIIMSIYVLVLMPAITAPLIWATVLDRRYRARPVRGAVRSRSAGSTRFPELGLRS